MSRDAPADSRFERVVRRLPVASLRQQKIPVRNSLHAAFRQAAGSAGARCDSGVGARPVRKEG